MKFKITDKKFITNDKVVVCIITTEMDRNSLSGAEYGVVEGVNYKRLKINFTNPLYKEMTFKGIAKCNKEDVFDLYKGKILAESRAMEKLKRYSSNFFYECANKASELASKFMQVAESEASLRNANSTKISEILLES